MSYHKKQQDKHKLKHLYNETWHSYGAGAYYDERKNRYIKYSCHNKWTRTHCRRMTRRRLKNVDYSCPNGYYKKMYDYWWEII